MNVGAPGGPCVVGFDKTTGREVWRAGKEWGPSYASPVPAIIHGTAARVRVRRRRIESADRRTACRSIRRTDGWILPFRGAAARMSPSMPRVRSSSTTRCSSRRAIEQEARCRDSAGLLSQAAVDDAGVRAAFQHAGLQGRVSLRVRWTERARRLARVRRCRERQSRVARDPRVDGDDRGRRPAPAAARRDVSRVVAGRRWAVPVPRRARAPALDGPHAEGIQGDVARVAVCGARVVGTAGAEPRPALRRAEHAGHADVAPGRGCCVTTCGRRTAYRTPTSAGAPAPPCACSRQSAQSDRRRQS